MREKGRERERKRERGGMEKIEISPKIQKPGKLV